MSVFMEAIQAGMHTTVHAGEWGGAAFLPECDREALVESLGNDL